MVLISKIDNRSYIEPRSATFFSCGWCIVEHFCPKRYGLGKLALYLPSKEPIIFVFGARINPVATTPIALPRTPTLLEPDRKECPQVPLPNPRELLPVGKSNIRKAPTMGRQSFS